MSGHNVIRHARPPDPRGSLRRRFVVFAAALLRSWAKLPAQHVCTTRLAFRKPGLRSLTLVRNPLYLGNILWLRHGSMPAARVFSSCNWHAVVVYR